MKKGRRKDEIGKTRQTRSFQIKSGEESYCTQFLALPCLALCGLVLSDLALPALCCLILSCLVLSCLVLPCLVLSSLMWSCLVLSCRVLWLSCLVHRTRAKARERRGTALVKCSRKASAKETLCGSSALLNRRDKEIRIPR